MELENYFDFLNADDIRIKGTRVGIETVLDDYLEGASPEEIAARYRTLTLEQVYATITYYLRNQEEVDEYLERWRAYAEAAWQEQQRNPPPLERIVADAVMVNLALLTALALRFLSFFVLGTGQEGGATLQTYSGLFWSFWRAYRSHFWLLTLICLIAFYLSGFYTHGRAYRSRYKTLIIVQAVSLSYLLFGFLTYMQQFPF